MRQLITMVSNPSPYIVDFKYLYLPGPYMTGPCPDWYLLGSIQPWTLCKYSAITVTVKIAKDPSLLGEVTQRHSLICLPVTGFISDWIYQWLDSIKITTLHM
jgi:hypothetical protein